MITKPFIMCSCARPSMHKNKRTNIYIYYFYTQYVNMCILSILSIRKSKKLLLLDFSHCKDSCPIYFQFICKVFEINA